MYRRKGEYDKAVRDFSEVSRLRPVDASFHLMRGNAYDEKEEYDKAIKDNSQNNL